MLGRRVTSLILVVFLLLLAPSAAFGGAGSIPGKRPLAADFPSAECAQLAWYNGELQAIGESIDSEESIADTDNMETWTEADYDAAIAAYDTILAQWDSVTPPPAAVTFHQAIRDGIALFQVALETMKTAGPFAILAYLDQFDQLNKQAADAALPLEAECGIALYDNDDDGVPEVGPGVATPESGDETAAAEPVPVGTSLDGRPIMPIGATVQTSDAF